MELANRVVSYVIPIPLAGHNKQSAKSEQSTVTTTTEANCFQIPSDTAVNLYYYIRGVASANTIDITALGLRSAAAAWAPTLRLHLRHSHVTCTDQMNSVATHAR